jgi:hypothetical protein
VLTTQASNPTSHLTLNRAVNGFHIPTNFLRMGEHTMAVQDFTTTITVSQSPAVAFAAIKNVSGWWTGDIDRHADDLGDEFI